MKFYCLTSLLNKALAVSDRFTGKNLSLPILGSVLLEAEDSLLKITATNLEYAVQIDIPGKGSQGKICIPSKILSSFLSSVSDEKIMLEEKQGNLNVKSKDQDAKIIGVPAADYPLMPKIKSSHNMVIETAEFKKGLEKVLPAVSLSEFKPELAGVYCKIDKNLLTIAATDTFRLAEYKINLERKNKDSFDFLIPARVAQEVVRSFDESEDLEINLGENQITLECGKIKIFSRLIEGSFPDYKSIIPNVFENTCLVSKDSLVNTIKASSIFSSKLQEITIEFLENKIGVKSTNSDVGSNDAVIEALCNGRKINLSFNYRYVLDGVNSIDDDEVFIGCNNEQTPCLMRNKNSDNFLYVLMPIRSV